MKLYIIHCSMSRPFSTHYKIFLQIIPPFPSNATVVTTLLLIVIIIIIINIVFYLLMFNNRSKCN